MTNKKRPNACHGRLYGGSEAGGPPPISPERKLSGAHGPLGLPGGPVVYMGVGERDLRTSPRNGGRVTSGRGGADPCEFWGENGASALSFSESSGLLPTRPEVCGCGMARVYGDGHRAEFESRGE